MKIKLEEYKKKDFFRIVPEMISYDTIRDLGLLDLRTWMNMIKNRSRREIFKVICKGKFCGLTTFTKDPRKSILNIGGMTFKKYRNLGIATQRVRELVKYAKKNGIRKIRAETLPGNIRSKRVLEKNEFRIIGKEHKYLLWELKIK